MIQIKAATVAKTVTKNKNELTHKQLMESSIEKQGVTIAKSVSIKAPEKPKSVFNDDAAGLHADRPEATEDSQSGFPWPPKPHTYILDFPIEKLVMIDQPRKEIDVELCKQLADSVSTFTEEGAPLYEHPVSGWYCPERDKVVIKNGGRRTTGAIACNWKTINLITVESQGELERSFDQVLDNLHVESMNPFDVAYKFLAWNNEGYSFTQIAERLGMSKSRVASFIALAKMPSYLVDFGMLYLSNDVDAYGLLSKLDKINHEAALKVVNQCKVTKIFNRGIASKALKEEKSKNAVNTIPSQLPTKIEATSYSKPTISVLNNAFDKLSKEGHNDTPVFFKDSTGEIREMADCKVEMTEDGPRVIFEI